ncbi:hypothetical protein O6H91_08G035200 [Diphasiastrum complanatum]|uniref:Uncharacterized protein n=1 Tax=Diphasiastrum complanatum TaxID=34168 RepID=A0ACC2CWB4_DIPCM|nr:hypothetical protein O6H91_08G035200 [Diphasiastrum complanatum]
MGKKRLSSAALLRIQAQLVAQLRSYNAKRRVDDQSVVLRSGDTSRSVSVDYECCDSDDSVNQQGGEMSINCLSSAALRQIQAQIVAHLRAYNAKLGIRTKVEVEEPCRPSLMATAESCSGEAFDLESSCNNDCLVSTSCNASEYDRDASKSCTSRSEAACCSIKRNHSSLYSADISAVCEPATVDFTRIKKRFRSFPAREEWDESRGSEMAYGARNGYSYVLDGTLSGQMREHIKPLQNGMTRMQRRMVSHSVLQDRPGKTDYREDSIR